MDLDLPNESGFFFEKKVLTSHLQALKKCTEWPETTNIFYPWFSSLLAGWMLFSKNIVIGIVRKNEVDWISNVFSHLLGKMSLNTLWFPII